MNTDSPAADVSVHAPLLDRLRGRAFLPGVHYVTQAEAWMREAADEIERLRTANELLAREADEAWDDGFREGQETADEHEK